MTFSKKNFYNTMFIMNIHDTLYLEVPSSMFLKPHEKAFQERSAL